MSFLSSSRTVLILSDEALYIYAISRAVRVVDVVPWDDSDFVDKVAKILVKDCGGKSVVILNDMVEQHYRKERVPPVGIMDQANVIKRKLNVAFPSYPVRAALALKEKAPTQGGGKGKGKVYIFSAVPASEGFEKTMAAVRKSLCSISGFGLLPIESAGLVRKMSEKLTPKGKKPPVWSLLMGQHQHGGLRQIVTKNGELALTRMTPVIDTDDDPHEWSQQFYQEFKATMSYLSRFGFNPEQGLDVMAITNPQASDLLADMINVDCNFHALTVREAAKLAGVNVGGQKSQRYADALHVAWIGKKPRLSLPMRAQQIETVSRPRQIAALATILLLGFAGYQGYQALTAFQGMQEAQSELDEVRSKQKRLSRQYDEEVARKEALGFDVKLVQAAVDVHGDYEAKALPVLNVADALGRALGRDLRIDKVEISRVGEKNSSQKGFSLYGKGAQGEKKGKASYEVTFQMTFPGTTDIDRGNKEVSDLKDRLELLLPDHKVEVLKYLKDYEYVDELVVESGDKKDDKVVQDFIASIKIEGPPA